jgi:hypothetical protein
VALIEFIDRYVFDDAPGGIDKIPLSFKKELGVFARVRGHAKAQ